MGAFWDTFFLGTLLHSVILSVARGYPRSFFLPRFLTTHNQTILAAWLLCPHITIFSNGISMSSNIPWIPNVSPRCLWKKRGSVDLRFAACRSSCIAAWCLKERWSSHGQSWIPGKKILVGWLVQSPKGKSGAPTGSNKFNHGIAGTPAWSLQDPYLSKGPNSFMPPAAVWFISSRKTGLAELVPVQTRPSACSQNGLDECHIWLTQAPAGNKRDRAFGHLPSQHRRSQCEISH